LERLKRWNVTLYCTDDFGPYDSLLPVGRHDIGKDDPKGSAAKPERSSASTVGCAIGSPASDGAPA
jgi:IS1 family transposase